MVPSGSAALHAVTGSSFDSGSRAVVQRDPGIPQSGSGAGSVAYRRVSPQELVVRTTTDAPRLVVLHDAFDSGWTYSVDGSEPQHVLAADYFLQAVPVPAVRLHLPPHHPVVHPAGPHQFLVRPPLDHLAGFHQQDEIGPADGGEAVGDHERRPPG